MENFLSDKKLTVEQQIAKKTIISFFFLFLFFAGAIWGWKWLQRQPSDGAFGAGIKEPLRKVLNKNENFFNKWLSDHHYAKEYPVSAAVKNVRVNGDIGMGKDFDPSTWQ